jgi:protease-4
VRFAREIRRLRQDDDVKAIVLRVNSPGGSASAAEHIQRELRLAREAKPVVVSMGSYAASGGYWISAYADRIFAEPTTVTGSIGVFGLHLDVQELANERLGITWDSVKTGRFADSFGIDRPKSPEELAIVQGLVDWIYDEFVAKVAEGRKLERTVVEEIAQGRVWSGADAVRLGLVDELGGLDAALADAAERAGLGGDFRVVEFPRKKPLAEAIAEFLEGVVPSARAPGAATRLIAQIERQLAALERFNDPRGVYARLPVDLNLR